MADHSDDEFEHRRDKFRGERPDYPVGGPPMRDARRMEGGRRPREDWSERGRDWNGRGMMPREYGGQPGGEYRGRIREREYSPPRRDMSPPAKRMRSEWEERRYPAEGPPHTASYPPSYGGYPDHLSQATPHAGIRAGEELGPTQPPMMSFKIFMEQCDETISADDAAKKYQQYKTDFKKQQINDFFINHKEEEWFKSKYHPEDCIKKKEELVANLNRRILVFTNLSKSGRLDVAIDADQSHQLLKLLDSVFIKLEGGSDIDLNILDEATEEEIAKSSLGNERETNGVEKVPLTEDEIIHQKAKEYLAKKKNTARIAKKKRKRSRSSSSSSSGSSSSSESSSSDSDEEVAPPGVEKKKDSEPLPPGMAARSTEVTEVAAPSNGATLVTPPTPSNAPAPRPLHKTASIFLRNLAPTITKAEVEEMCRRYEGFLRAAIADPQPERRWFRRGWVTFKRNVNIKDICWNLNTTQLRDCELGAIVNRDLSRRVRTVNGITSHRPVVKSDVKLAAKIVQNLDNRHGLWTEPDPDREEAMGISSSNNPVLRNITDYLIEEADAEEDELMGENKESKEDKCDGEPIERDETLIKVLDRLLLYLRIVHSVDYYNHSEYPNEDEMPNRCGIIHARGIPPVSKVYPQEISDYTRTFENKIGSFIQPLTKLSDDDSKKLGLKDAEDEVEKFVNSNAKKLTKEKWLCQLCGKKFKGAEFVHKHILSKHAEKVKEVQKEVDYFNAYLRDPKRPQLPEFPTKSGNYGPRKDVGGPDSYVASYPQPGYGGGRYGAAMPQGTYPFPHDPFYQREAYPPRADPFRAPPRPAYRSRSDGGDPRELVAYNDLEIPGDVDLF